MHDVARNCGTCLSRAEETRALVYGGPGRRDVRRGHQNRVQAHERGRHRVQRAQRLHEAKAGHAVGVRALDRRRGVYVIDASGWALLALAVSVLLLIWAVALVGYANGVADEAMVMARYERTIREANRTETRHG